MICGTLVPRLGLEPGISAVRAQSPNPWTITEFPTVRLCDSSHPMGVKWDLIVVLVCMSPVAKGVDCIFMYILAICIS